MSQYIEEYSISIRPGRFFLFKSLALLLLVGLVLSNSAWALREIQDERNQVRLDLESALRAGPDATLEFSADKIGTHSVSLFGLPIPALQQAAPDAILGNISASIAGLEEIRRILIAGSDSQVVGRAMTIAQEVFPDALIATMPLPLQVNQSFNPGDLAILTDYDPMASDILLQDFFRHVVMAGEWDVDLDEKGLRRSLEMLQNAGGLEETSDLQLVRGLPGHEDAIAAIAVSPDGKTVASGGSDRSIRLWDQDTGSVRRVLRGDAAHAPLIDLNFSPDGEQVVSVDEKGLVRIWAVATGELLSTFLPEVTGPKRPSDTFTYAFFDSAGQGQAVVSDGAQMRLWDVANGRLIRTIHTFTDLEKEDRLNSIRDAEIGPQRQQLATAGNQIRIWDLETGTFQSSAPFEREMTAVTWSQDGSQIAAGGFDKQVQVWSVQALDSPRQAAQLGRTVRSVAFAPDGQSVAVAGHSNQIVIGSLTQQPSSQTLTGYSGFVIELTYGLDGSRLFSGGDDRTLYLWGPSDASIEEKLKAPAGSPLWNEGVRLQGLQGSSAAVGTLLGLQVQADAAMTGELVLSSLSAAAHPQRPAPFASDQWARLFESTARLSASDSPPSREWIGRFERVFVDALALEGPPLDSAVFREGLLDLIFSLSPDSLRRDAAFRNGFLAMNPKDQLAVAAWAFGLFHRAPERAQERMVVLQGLVQEATPYQDLIRAYELLHRFPRPTEVALFAGAVQALSYQGTPRRRYWTGFQQWFVQSAILMPPFEILGLQPAFLSELSPRSWHATPQALVASVERLEDALAQQGSRILGVQFDSADPVFTNRNDFTPRDRDRFLKVLIYQAEHRGESLRLALAAYFLALEQNPQDRQGAIEAAEAVLLERSPEPPNPRFLEGPRPRDYVVEPSGPAVDSPSGGGEAAWQRLRETVDLVLEDSDIPAHLKESLQAFQNQAAAPATLEGAAEAVRNSLRTATQIILDGLNGTDDLGPSRARVQAVRTAANQWVRVVAQQAQQSRLGLFRIRVERDPVNRLLFNHPSLLCLDCMTGLFRSFSQYYVTNLHQSILVAEDLNHPNQDPLPAFLTLSETETGALIATNELVASVPFDFLPVFVDALERYAEAVGRPVILPEKFFSDRPGEHWVDQRLDVTLPRGADPMVHFDLALTASLPYTDEDRLVWIYDPDRVPSDQRRSSDFLGPVQLNALLTMKEQLLGARTKAEVVGAFLVGVQETLGFDGAMLYWVDPTSGQIQSAIRSLEAPSRFQERSEATGELAEALRQDGPLHLRDRFSTEVAHFVDPVRLEEDAQRFGRKNAEEILWLPLTNASGARWGLLGVQNWQSGRPLFTSSGERLSEDVGLAAEMLEALGNGTLLALETVQAHERENVFLGLGQVGGQLAGALSQVISALTQVKRSAETILKQSELEALSELAGEVDQLTADLKNEAAALVAIAGQRKKWIQPVAARSRSLQTIEDTQLVQSLLSDLGLSLLSAVSNLDLEGVDQAQRIFIESRQTDNPVLIGIVVDWSALARSAIEVQSRLARENTEFLPRLEELQERLGLLRGLQTKMGQVLEKNSLESALADQIREANRQVGEVERRMSGFLRTFSQLIQPQAGLEELQVLLDAPAARQALNTQGFVRTSGGFLARSVALSPTPGRLILQTGLSRPQALPGSVPVLWADETTLAGMLAFVQATGVTSTDNFLFNGAHFTKTQAMAVLPATHPMPASAILQPGLNPTAQQIAVILHISRETGTIYVANLVSFTAADGQDYLFIQIQA